MDTQLKQETINRIFNYKRKLDEIYKLIFKYKDDKDFLETIIKLKDYKKEFNYEIKTLY